LIQSFMPVRSVTKARQDHSFMLVRAQGSSGRWRIYPIIHASQGRVQGSSGGGLMQSFMLVRSVAKGSSGSGLMQSFMLARAGSKARQVED